MQHLRTLLLVPLLLAWPLARAQEFTALSESTPQLIAVKVWHSALLAGDFSAYKRAIPDLQAQPASRAQFDELRKWTPESVKVSAPRSLPNGNFELTMLGCKAARRQVVSIVVVKSAATWKVVATGWAQVWGSEARSCPV